MEMKERSPFRNHQVSQMQQMDPQRLRIKQLIESKYQVQTSQDWRVNHYKRDCFSSQTNIPPTAKRYHTSLVRACYSNKDSRAKAKIYSSLRHNRSLDDRSKKIIRQDRKENTPLHLMSVTQRNIPQSGLSASPALSSEPQMLKEEIRSMTTVVRKKRACNIPGSSISNEITAKPDQDNRIVDYYKSKYEVNTIHVDQISAHSHTPIPSCSQSRRKYLARVKAKPVEPAEICIEPW